MQSTDINEDNKDIKPSPLSLVDIQNFFDTYIVPYTPYQGEKIYNVLMRNISKYYYDQLYNVIPNDLKQIYENTNIETPKIYNQLLINIGVPQSIINKISLSDKLIFLQTFADFMRYKGTVSFFEKITRTFNDRISIYELFIDKNINNEWVFKPVKIFVNENMALNIDEIQYDLIYNSSPSLLMDKDQLNTLNDNEQLLLPIKSNFLLLENDSSITEISILYEVIIAIFLNEYKDVYIEIYFDNNSDTIQLKTFYYLWYYLLTSYYGTSWTEFSKKSILRFIYGEINFPKYIGNIPTTINNLHEIIEKYNKINIISTPQRDYDNCHLLMKELYNDINNAFYTDASGSEITENDMYNELLTMSPLIINYITNRINNSSSKKQEVSLILNELYSSLLLFTSNHTLDNYFSMYIDYFLHYLPQIIINPENTTTYTILYNLKPYHVELYSTNNIGVKCYNKFNQVYIDDETDMNFLYQVQTASILEFENISLMHLDFKTISDITEPVVYDVEQSLINYITKRIKSSITSSSNMNCYYNDYLLMNEFYNDINNTFYTET